MKNQKQLIDRAEVYRRACAGCTRHGEELMECYHDEPCERLIFEFTTAEPVNAAEVVIGAGLRATNRDELIAALRCCIKNEDASCVGNCPYNGETGCVDMVMADALALLEGMNDENT